MMMFQDSQIALFENDRSRRFLPEDVQLIKTPY